MKYLIALLALIFLPLSEASIIVPATTIQVIGTRPAEASMSFTRPANVYPYAPGLIISNTTSGLTQLLPLAVGIGNSTPFWIQSVRVISSNGAATVRLQPALYVFSNSTVTGAGYNDASIFNPSTANVTTAGNTFFENIPTSVPIYGGWVGTGSITTTYLTVNTTTSGTLAVGQYVNGGGNTTVAANTVITVQNSATNYTVSTSQSVYTTGSPGALLAVGGGGTSYIIKGDEYQRLATTDSNGYVYLALIAENGYVPASGETFTILLKYVW